MPALLERPKMTRSMYEALKRHIMNERAKIKQEQEQDAMIERLRKEREQRKKKEEEEALTLEQTKEQIAQLEKRLDQLRSDKHELFLQLKKVLNQEEETRRRAQMKEQSEMLSLQQQAAYTQHSLGPSGHSVMLQPTHMSNRPTLYKPVTMPQTAMKRPRSPSPPPSSSYQSSYHSDNKYGYSTGKPGPSSHLYAQHGPTTEFKMGSYPQTQSSQPVYASNTAHSFVAQQQQPAVTAFQAGQTAPGKYTGGQSAFSSYPSHYTAHQTSKAEGFAPSYGLQRMPQPGFHAPPQHGASLQHQLEQAQKSGFAEDKYKQSTLRGLGSSQQGALMSQALMQQQQSKSSPKVLDVPPPINNDSYPILREEVEATVKSLKKGKSAGVDNIHQLGSIVTGMPGQASSSYQPAPATSTYQPQPGSSGRPAYPGQSHRQYY